MKILITGGTGMLGKHLQEILPKAIFLSSKDYDLRDSHECNKLISIEKPNIIIHSAAIVGGIKANLENPVNYFEDNILMNTNLLKYSYKYGVKRFIGILSTCAYPDTVECYPMSEEDLHKGPPSISNFGYGYAKRCLAIQIEAYNKQYGTKYQYLIPSNLYSEYDNHSEKDSHFINTLIHKIIKAEQKGEKEITLWGTGKPLRQCTYALDLAKIILHIIENNITESFNISNPYNSSIEDIAKGVLINLGYEDWKINWVKPELDGQYRKDVSIDKMLKYIPNFSFTGLEGINKVYNKIKSK